jgi:hypothetical protein
MRRELLRRSRATLARLWTIGAAALTYHACGDKSLYRPSALNYPARAFLLGLQVIGLDVANK